MIDLRIFNRPWQALGFQGGPGDVEPVEAFRAYHAQAEALNQALVRGDDEAALLAMVKRKELDQALDVLCGRQLREGIKASRL